MRISDWSSDVCSSDLVAVDGTPIELTATEFGLLTALAAAPGRVYSRAELLNRVRGYEIASERTVDSHIRNLRRKVEPDSAHPTVVETVLGVGYRLGIHRDHRSVSPPTPPVPAGHPPRRRSRKRCGEGKGGAAGVQLGGPT